MSDGANTNTTTCTNCSEQDSITIAGKSFCANCGTPQQSPTPGSQVAPASSVTPSLSTDSHAAAITSVPPAERMPTVGSSSASPATNSQVAQSATDGAVVQARLKADQLDSALSTQQSTSISKFASATEPSALTEERGDKEFGSLDDKSGESVMSDATLDELSKASNDSMLKEESPPTIGPSVIDPGSSQATATGGIEAASSPLSTVAPAQSSTAPAPEPVMPRQSNYKLDLSQAQSSSLPKAVSDVRPAAAVSSVTSSAPAQTATKPAPIAPAAVVAPAPVAPAPAPVSSPASTMPPVQVAPSVAPLSSAPAVPASPVPAVASVMASTPVAQPAAAVAPAKGVRASSVALSLVGLLLVGGYIWQVNYPNLALKVAGSKAGISANFPGYVPNGWKLSGNIQSSPGNISYNIANAKGGKSLQVSESKTNWDSQALAENYVAPKAENYLALQAQGLTIYLYDGNQASWVNNGTWYRVEGNGHGLSQDQVIKLATSL